MAYELDFATDGYFDGPAIALGADFKIEFDLKTGAQVATNEWIFNSWDAAGNDKQFIFRINNSQFQSFISFDGAATVTGPVTSTIAINTLYNVVVDACYHGL